MELIKEASAMKVNQATVEIVKAYLEYSSSLIRTVVDSKSYSTPFKDLDDNMIIQPEELIDLVNKVQKALVSAQD